LQAREDPYSNGDGGPARFISVLLSPMDIAARKQAMREEQFARRAEFATGLAAKSERLAKNFLRSVPIPARSTVSAYVAIGEEADPAPLIEALRARGHAIALPRVVGKGQPLSFHLYEAGAKLVPGIFGLSQPAPDWPEAIPDILAVPLLAFDGDGNRLGYGAGFYDRTLAGLRAHHKVLAVGYAFADQEVAAVPHRDSDEKLDGVVTEKGARWFER